MSNGKRGDTAQSVRLPAEVYRKVRYVVGLRLARGEEANNQDVVTEAINFWMEHGLTAADQALIAQIAQTSSKPSK